MALRIAIIHALRASIDPIARAFAACWPEARTFNLLDDSLSIDVAQAGFETPAIQRRIAVLADYAVETGAVAILYSCSAFGRSIDQVKRAHSIPVLKPNEAMLEEALGCGRRIGVLATFAPTLASIGPEFERLAQARGIALDLRLTYVRDALDALDAGAAARHDDLVAEAARRMDDRDAVVLAQASMARARARVQAGGGPPVLTSPESAVARLKSLLQPSAAQSETPSNGLNPSPDFG